MTTAAHDGRPTLEGFEPFSPDYLRDPFPVWERALRDRPVFYCPPLDLWVITRYDDIAAATADWRTFSNRATDFVPVPEQLVERVGRNLFGEHSLLASDPPVHTVSRKTANRSFTRSRIAAAEPFIAALADELVDGFESERRCDLLPSYGYAISKRTITHLLGLPAADARLFSQWAEDHFALMTPRSSVSGEADGTLAVRMAPEERVERWTRVAEAVDYFRELIEDRRRQPRDDMISDMVAARDADGRPALSDWRIIVHCQEMISAGSDTTGSLIGVATMYLTADRELHERVRADPSLVDRVVEETLRRHGSARGMFRFTTREVTVAGVTIPANASVYLAFQAAGQDPSHFPDPARFDIDRRNLDEHLAFGRGRHFCPGAPIARLEATVALRTLTRRLPGLRVVPGQTLEYAQVITGALLEHLEVEWD
jgi:cytochrome P450